MGVCMIIPLRPILGLLISTLLHCAISIVHPFPSYPPPYHERDASPSCPLLIKIAGELSTPFATCPPNLSGFLKLSPLAFQS